MKIILSFLFLMSSCSLFKSIRLASDNEYPKATSDNAIVYFMQADTHTGSMAKWTVSEIRKGSPAKNIGVFTAGTYFYHITEPGEVTYEIVDPAWGSSLGYKSMKLEKGKTYYLEFLRDSGGLSSISNQKTGLVFNNSINLKDHLEAMRMIDIKASRSAWE